MDTPSKCSTPQVGTRERVCYSEPTALLGNVLRPKPEAPGAAGTWLGNGGNRAQASSSGPRRTQDSSSRLPIHVKPHGRDINEEGAVVMPDLTGFRGEVGHSLDPRMSALCHVFNLCSEDPRC